MAQTQANPSAMESKPTMSLQETFEWGRVLGKGTFGEVILVHDKVTHQAFAMKVITKASLKSRQDLNFLLREIKILKKIQHENIMRLFQVFESEKKVYLQMEYCEGGELFYRIVNKGYLAEVESRVIIQSLLKAVEYLHANNVVHRDIKPENILLATTEGLDDAQVLGKAIKLADFGLSNMMDQGVLLRTQCGSLAYTAPEVLNGKKQGYSFPVDMWSVGVVAFVLLAGYFPFKTDSESGMYDHILKCKYNFEAEIWNHVSPLAKDFISKLLILDPNQRLTASQALNHDWFTQPIVKPIPTTTKMVSKSIMPTQVPIPVAERSVEGDSIAKPMVKPATFYPPDSDTSDSRFPTLGPNDLSYARKVVQNLESSLMAQRVQKEALLNKLNSLEPSRLDSLVFTSFVDF